MAKGAKQKSNVVLMATGSKHARPLEPKMRRKIGPPPAHFQGVALETWKWAVEVLAEVGTLFEADRVGLETLCLAKHRLWKLQAIVDEEGECIDDPVKGMIPHPILTKMPPENNIIARLLAEFGLTPASRGKVQGNPETKPNRFAGF